MSTESKTVEHVHENWRVFNIYATAEAAVYMRVTSSVVIIIIIIITIAIYVT